MWMILLATAGLAESNDLEIEKRTKTRVPDFQKEDNGQIHCYARVLVDTRGKPSEIDVKGCNDRFASAARESLAKWRWTTPIAPTHTIVAIVFVEHLENLPAPPCAHTVTIASDGTVTDAGGTCVLWLPPKVAAPESRQICRVTRARGQKTTIDGCKDDALVLAQAWVDASDWRPSGMVQLELLGPDFDPETDPVNLPGTAIE